MRQLLALLALALLMGGGYFTLKYFKEKKALKEGEEKRIFPAETLKQARTIEIYRQSETPKRILLRKEGNRWWIVEPIRYRAVDATLDSLISQIAEKTYERSFSPKKPLSVYGFDPPRYMVTFYTETSSYTLAVGNVLTGPGGGRVYIGRGATHPSEILITFTGFQYHLSRNLDDYRSRDVVWEFPTNVTYMRMVSESGSYTLTRATDGWYLGAKPLDSSKVEAILSRLRTLTVRDFYGDYPTATPPSGEKEPKRMIILQGDTPLTYWFYSPNTKESYVPVRTSERPTLMSIVEYAYKDLWKSPSELTKPVEVQGAPPGVTAPQPPTLSSQREGTPPVPLTHPAPPMSLLPQTQPVPKR